MTKTLKLTDDFIKSMQGKKCINGKTFFTYTDPINHKATLAESFRPKDIASDHTKVPIYVIPEEVRKKYRLKKEAIPEEEIISYIVRYEGSNATPSTPDVECYGCCKDETMIMPIALANRWLDQKVRVKNSVGQFISKNIMEEVT